MKKFIGNLSDKLDCDKLINTLQQHTVAPCHGHMELDSTNPFYQEYIEQTRILKQAGYDESTVEYRHYQSGTHFDKQVELIISELTGAIPLLCWISEIRPGKCTPRHWDINPWEKEQEKLGELVRYFCFLSKPTMGHVFVTSEDCYYMEEQGNVYQYSHRHEWHAGANVGLEPKFLLTFTGYQ
jgi:hypothetical protein